MRILGVRITKVRLLIGAVIVALLMAFPPTRMLVWWLLPAGSGNDDIIQGLALGIIVVIVFIEVWTKRYPDNPYDRRSRRRWEQDE